MCTRTKWCTMYTALGMLRWLTHSVKSVMTLYLASIMCESY